MVTVSDEELLNGDFVFSISLDQHSVLFEVKSGEIISRLASLISHLGVGHEGQSVGIVLSEDVVGLGLLTSVVFSSGQVSTLVSTWPWDFERIRQGKTTRVLGGLWSVEVFLSGKLEDFRLTCAHSHDILVSD